MVSGEGMSLGILRRFRGKKVQFFFEILTLVQTFRDFSYYSSACSINLGDHVVITGGYISDTQTTVSIVSRYNDDGWVSDMASLNQARNSHGCTSYTSGGEQVRLTT